MMQHMPTLGKGCRWGRISIFEGFSTTSTIAKPVGELRDRIYFNPLGEMQEDALHRSEEWRERQGKGVPLKVNSNKHERKRHKSKCPRIALGVLLALTFLGVLAGVIYAIRHRLHEAAIMDPALDLVLTSDPLPYDNVPSLWRDDEFECLGWRATDNCNPRGPRMPARDKPCDAMVVRGDAGTCEVRNRTSGQVFHVMATTCLSTRRPFTCNMARAFTDFSKQIATYKHVPAPQFTSTRRGVVFSIYMSTLPSVFAIVRLLRSYGCILPIEFFYHADEITVDTNALLQRMLRDDRRISLRPIDDPAATRFRTKPYAIYHSAFDQVLLLDCDNIPLHDPTYLFDSVAFVTHGAIFWPDLWHPGNTIFSVQPQSLLWQLLDMHFSDEWEQESGMVLVDRRRRASAAALHKLMAYTFATNTLLESLELVYGDKDLFRLAWRNASAPYHFIETPPAFAGLYTSSWSTSLCGVAMVQHDPSGRAVFLHRNALKISGRRHELPLLTHVEALDARTDPRRFVATCTGSLENGQPCWGFRWPDVPTQITAIDWRAASANIHTAEAHAISFAKQARHILGLADALAPVPRQSIAWLWIFGILPVVCALLLLTWHHRSGGSRRSPSSLLVMVKAKRKPSALP
ncbi:Aste57867_13216 [Aphanomyces stellatus]|uniref:Aste57867_13216 protein n=1 Tax=Aphanomyces stellatus TaxID=120398 RepID=A0A485KY09_9STRA|nr:hypothetical protein As57867_013167 [Aphanomyces stellatus]VFT90056.1 Aste57867_13216 [Aphanomyces stellatus]